MYNDKKVTVVMPVFNAVKTIKRTYDDVVSMGVVDSVIIVDDASSDETVDIALKLPLAKIHRHQFNMGYGANQKSCYKKWLWKREAIS